MKVAYVGLGNIGAPHARLIAREGFELAVYDPNPAAMQVFNGLARLAVSAADAATGAEIACVCVRDDVQVRDVILGPGGLSDRLAANALILIHSTVSIDLLHALQTELSIKRIALVDAPISRTRRTDDQKFVFTMLGGDPADIARAVPLINSFSTDFEHMGDLGAGMAAKIANNLVTWTHLVVGSQAAALAARHGVAYAKMRRVMMANGNLTPAVEQFLDSKNVASSGAEDVLAAVQTAQAGIGEKDLLLAIESGEAFAMDMSVASAARRTVREVMTGRASYATKGRHRV